MFEAMMGLSPVILGVLGLLIAFSVASWGILLMKTLQINKAERKNRGFLDFFEKATDLAQISRSLAPYEGSPLVPLFRGGYGEIDVPRMDRTDHEVVGRNLQKISAREIGRLEKDTSFLATTAATTPFIGLFGTVWGIMNAFNSIGQAGSTSLAIVAPGISEALVTTAIGLAVAIPAVIGYNYLQNRIRRVVEDIDIFSCDFLNKTHKMVHPSPVK